MSRINFFKIFKNMFPFLKGDTAAENNLQAVPEIHDKILTTSYWLHVEL
jgi:hypothetical protein